MNTRFFNSGCLAVGILLSGMSVFAANPPNVLFISVDDLNDWIGVFAGHPQAKTPHIDKFAATGSVVFQEAHCAGPVCGPSRSALLSGFMPHRSGLYGNQNNMLDSALVQKYATLPEYFSKHGYRSISRGKIFHAHATAKGRDRGHWAFDVYESGGGGSGVDRSRVYSRDKNLINGKPGPKSKYPKGGGSEFAWGPTKGGKEETSDYQTAQWAAGQLQDKHDRPFFLAVGLLKPHLPFYVPQEFYDLYDPQTTKTNEIREDDLDDILRPDGKPKTRPSPDYLWLKENNLINTAARAYLAASSYADACLGVIFDGLKKSPHYDNTIVILWGDHGWHLGEKLRYRKATGWHESTRVPLIVRLPGMTERNDCNRLVNLIDFYPTLIELCGLPRKSVLDGRSFVPLLEDPTRNWNYPTTTIFGKGNASIHDQRWHYLRYADGTEELYDLDADPMEWTNLIRQMNSEAARAHNRLNALYPATFAPVVPPNAANTKANKRGGKGLDQTIKPRRRLADLK
jgi:arylsulfatase A-like enzyme